MVALALGVPLGLIAGFRGGWLDNIMMRVMDSIHSIPGIIFILAVAEVSDQRLRWVLVAVSLVYVPTLVRLVRATTLSLREEVFIEASLAIGTPTRSIGPPGSPLTDIIPPTACATWSKPGRMR